MRFVLAGVSFFLSSAIAIADDVTVQPRVVAATVFPQGTSISLVAQAELPAGSHVIRMPFGLDATPRFKVSDGVAITSVALQSAATYDATAILTPEQQAAFDALEAARDRTIAQMDLIAGTRQAIEAAELQIEFLTSIRGAGSDAPDAEALRSVTTMLAQEFAAARQAKATAEAAMRDQNDTMLDLQRDLTTAREAYERLSPPKGTGPMLVVSLETAAAGQVALQAEAFDWSGGWSPSYDLRLTTGDTPTLEIVRKVDVANGSGLSWRGIDLTLSTADPSGQSEPSPVFQDTARIGQARKDFSVSSLARSAPAAEPIIEPEVIVEDAGIGRAALAEIEGGVVQYRFPEPVTFDGPSAILTFDTKSMPVETRVVAVPRRDATAFLVAGLTNDTGEPLLPGQASIFRDGVYVAGSWLPLVPAGAEADIPVGPQEGIRLSRTFLNRETGDRGLVSRSNRREEAIRVDIENLTDQPVDLRALYATPVSEQEDLKITTRLQPQPGEQNVEDKRGVMAWDLTLAPGETQSIQLDFTLTWPEGEQLFWRP